MFRSMRRKERQLTAEQAARLLEQETYGVLSVHGDDGYPYGVPVNYAFVDGRILLHGTSENSHKLAAIQNDPKVCFTVVSRHELHGEAFAVYFSSVVVFGKAALVEQPAAKRERMRQMMCRLAPGTEQKTEQTCDKLLDALNVIEILPEHISGKSGQ